MAYNDTPTRDYADKLSAFENFAAPELRHVIATLGIAQHHRVLDVGCGSGFITQMLHEQVHENGACIGIDLSHAHCARTKAIHPNTAQANAKQLPFRVGCFDWVWASNTLNHFDDPLQWLHGIQDWLRAGGCIAIGQASYLPDMVFAWDARLEREVTYACRKYYARKYNLADAQLSAPRDWLGMLRAAGFVNVSAHTYVIERFAPLCKSDVTYFANWFRNYWDYRVQPFLSDEDWQAIQQLTDPHSPQFAPCRNDFHFVQTYTLTLGSKP